MTIKMKKNNFIKRTIKNSLKFYKKARSQKKSNRKNLFKKKFNGLIAKYKRKRNNLIN